MTRRIVFIGFNHRVTDPRLCYRQMRVLSNVGEGLRFDFLRMSFSKTESVEFHEQNRCGSPVNIIDVRVSKPTRSLLKPFRQSQLQERILSLVLPLFCDSRPDVIQASDIRELRFAVQLARRTQSRVFFDSHEDYLRQILDYGGGHPRTWLPALHARITELMLVKEFDGIFCTDDYLYDLYRRPMFRAKKVILLRNFPMAGDVASRAEVRDRECLDLVYAGGVNRYRGVIECARFVRLYNEQSSQRKLKFHVIGPWHPIVGYLVEDGSISWEDWRDYPDLMTRLRAFDVGVCLWLPIKKFARNLPVKNFDYMAAGLPVLTSDFGNLKKYIGLSGAGIGIDPQSFDQFRGAIDILFDPRERIRFSEMGRKWVLERGSFERESVDYCEAMFGT